MRGCKALAQRREELVARSIRQRNELIADVQTARTCMTPANIGANLWTTIKANGGLIAGVALAVVVFKPRRIIASLKTAIVAWQAWRNIAPAFDSLIKRC